MATCRDAWEEVSSSLGRSSAVGEHGSPRAMDVSLFGVELPNAWLEVSSAACDRNSWTSAVMLKWLSDLGGCSRVSCVGEVGAKVLWGAEASGTQLPGVNWERFTYKNVGSSSILALQDSDSGSDVTISSRLLLIPSRYTTWLSNCKSRCTSNWQRWPCELLLGNPSIIVLRWPSLGRGTCWASPLNCTKA